MIKVHVSFATNSSDIEYQRMENVIPECVLRITLSSVYSYIGFTVCGDGFCQAEEERCSTCPHDCGKCPLTSVQIGIIASFVVTCVIVVIGFLTVSIHRRRRKRSQKCFHLYIK